LTYGMIGGNTFRLANSSLYEG